MKEKKNARTKKTAVAAVGMAVVLAVGGIFAFMSDHDNAINKFKFTNDDGSQSIDIQLTETEWKEENGQNIVYGTPVAKNPVVENISTADNAKDVYAFASVVVPAKAVAISNMNGEYVNTANERLNNLEYVVVNNVSDTDIQRSDDDETEILGIFKDEALDEAYSFAEELGDTIYFKLNSTAPLGTAYTEDGEVAGEGDTVAYKVLEDTVDVGNCASTILGHKFMKQIVGVAGDVDLEDAFGIRELYTLEVKDNGAADRIIDGAWTGYTNAAGEVDGSEDGLDVYGRFAYHSTEEDGHWVEITNKISNKTVYVDENGRIYSAHVFYYNVPLAKGESTLPVFDYVELVNVGVGQLDENDDMNIYVDAYSVQADGLDDAINAPVENAQRDVNTAQAAYIEAVNGGNADNITAAQATLTAKQAALADAQSEEAMGTTIWSVLCNSEDASSFDLFSVVKATNA